MLARDKADRLIATIQGLKSLVSAFRPLDFRACATSAMHESDNGATIKKRILAHTGVDIQIIKNKEEADFVC